MFERVLAILFFIPVLLGCTSTVAAEDPTVLACRVTKPHWIKPPEDLAIQDPPAYSHYFTNEDQSILASASWAVEEKHNQNVAAEWIKIGWFRPEGAELSITGNRLDGDAPPLKAEASCCYPTRFQASGLYFPTEGCWEVTARAADRELSFTVWVQPKQGQPDSLSSSPPQ